MSEPLFTKQVIGELSNDVGPGPMNTFHTAADIDGDGLIDLVLCGRDGRMAWFDNPGVPGPWEMHLMDETGEQECGGSAVDLTGNGLPDIINGGDFRSDAVMWWENPGDPGARWERRVVVRTGATQIHDTLIGDITDGTPSLIFTNQGTGNGTNVYRVPLPDDPRRSPWPGLELIARHVAEPNTYNSRNESGMQPEEGLAIGDLDGDGRNELVSGTHWYKWTGRGWEKHQFARGYLSTKCAVGDLDGDGRNEIILSEGDPLVYGKAQGGKLSVFKPAADLGALWNEQVLADGLRDAHSLAIGDVLGSGRLDIFVGEIGLASPERGYSGRLPRLFLFENNGDGSFTRHIIDDGTGIHDGILIDARNAGVLDILGKPLHGAERWNAVVWYNNRGR